MTHPTGRVSQKILLKHMLSPLGAVQAEVEVDHDLRTVYVVVDAFDSFLIVSLVKGYLATDLNVVVFQDDAEGWQPPQAPYSMRLRIGGDVGVEFKVEVSRLLTDRQMTVRLSEPQVVASNPVESTREVDVTVSALVLEFHQVKALDATGHQYALTAKTEGIDYRQLQVGQRLRCTVTEPFPRVLRAWIP